MCAAVKKSLAEGETDYKNRVYPIYTPLLSSRDRKKKGYFRVNPITPCN